MSQPPPPPPASPPPPPPPGAPTSGAPFSIGNAVGFGWNAYWKNVGPMLLLTLVIFVVNMVVSMIGQAASDSVALNLAFAVVGWVVGLLLAFGLIRASLAVTRGERPEVAMLFQPEGFGAYILASILFGIGAAIGFILLVIPGIIFVIVYWFYGYVISEQGEGIGPIDALRRAAEISRGTGGSCSGSGSCSCSSTSSASSPAASGCCSPTASPPCPSPTRTARSTASPW